MIKYSKVTIIESLQFLFNKIRDPGYYPKSSNNGFVRSIYKYGLKEDPKNYPRKLFNMIFQLD